MTQWPTRSNSQWAWHARSAPTVTVIRPRAVRRPVHWAAVSSPKRCTRSASPLGRACHRGLPCLHRLSRPARGQGRQRPTEELPPRHESTNAEPATAKCPNPHPRCQRDDALFAAIRNGSPRDQARPQLVSVLAGGASAAAGAPLGGPLLHSHVSTVDLHGHLSGRSRPRRPSPWAADATALTIAWPKPAKAARSATGKDQIP
jgi:hypothetical protein